MIASLSATPAPARKRAVKPRPLMPLAAVMWRLDADEERVRTLIEDGELLWAFDIRGPKGKRAEVRVLTDSVTEYLAGTVLQRDEQEEWGRVSRLIIPHAKPFITGLEIRRVLSCGRQHTNNLVYGRQFRLVPGSIIRSGPGGSPKIEPASFKDWLRKRRIL